MSLADFSSSRTLSCQSFSASRCALADVVGVRDADQRNQPLADRLDLTDGVAGHRHARGCDPLDEDSHAAMLPRATPPYELQRP